MKKNHIVIIANNIDGGVGTFLNQISTLQSSTVTISLLSLKKAVHTPLPSFFSTAFYPTNSLFIWEELIWLQKKLTQEHPDVILTIDVHTSLLTCILKKLFFRNTRLIISNRNNVRKISEEKLPYVIQKSLQLLGHHFFSYADSIVCVSQGLATDFQQFFFLNKRVDYIANSIDIHKADTLSKKAIETQDASLFSSKKKIILSIGRLEQQKDFETLIYAIKQASKSAPNMQLIIIGDGSYKKTLSDLVKKLDLEQRVFLLGWRKNVYPYLAKSDIFILSSHYEGFGYVLLEAMSQGVPIIATDSPFGPAEVLSDNIYGLLTPLGNHKSMARHILNILNNKNLTIHYAQQSKKRVRDFSENDIFKKYRDLLI